MDLDGKLLPGIEDLDQQRKSLRFRRTQQFRAMGLHEPAQGLSRKRTVVNFADTLGTVGNLP